MLRLLTHWIDRAWACDGYSSILHIRQRLFWIAPILLLLPLIGLAQLLGASPTGPLVTTMAALGIVACVGMFSLSMYRWFVGYSSTERQEKQAEKWRAKRGRE